MKINIYLIESVININNNLINIILVYLYISIKIYIFFKEKNPSDQIHYEEICMTSSPPFNFILSFCLEKKSKKIVFSVRMPIYIYIYWVIILIKRIWGNQVWWNHMQEDNWFFLKNSLLWKNICMKRWYNSSNKFKIFPISK